VLGNGVDELTKLLFSLPSILDIGRGGIPPDYLALLVSQRIEEE
jgi:hypothetical protein